MHFSHRRLPDPSSPNHFPPRYDRSPAFRGPDAESGSADSDRHRPGEKLKKPRNPWLTIPGAMESNAAESIEKKNSTPLLEFSGTIADRMAGIGDESRLLKRSARKGPFDLSSSPDFPGRPLPPKNGHPPRRHASGCPHPGVGISRFLAEALCFS